MKCRWIFLVVAILFGSGSLFAETPIQAITFDQFNGTGTQSDPSPLTLALIPNGQAVSFFQMVSSNIDGPEDTGGGGAAVAWLENRSEIKAITFSQNGAGPLVTSGILDLGTVTPGAVVTHFLLGGTEPQTAGFGAFVAWVENGVDVKAITFDALGMGSPTISPTISLGSASPGTTITHFAIAGAYPEFAGAGAVVTWVENGIDIKANVFDQNGPVGSQIGVIDLFPATGVITDFLASGRIPQLISGFTVAWVENGVDIFVGVRIPFVTFEGQLNSSSPAPVEHFRLTGDFPGSDMSGAAVAWVEGGTNLKAVTYQCFSAPVQQSPILSLGTASSTVTDFQLTGAYPEAVGFGAAIAWVEGGMDVKAITFDAYREVSVNQSPPLFLGSTEVGKVSNFRLSGDNPESSISFGAAVAWTEQGKHVKAVTFDADNMMSTISDILPLGTVVTGGKIVQNFTLTGAFPEQMGTGAAVAWILGRDTPRSWKRPSNPRVAH